MPLVLLGLLVLLRNSASKTQVRRNSSKVEISAGDLTLGDIVEVKAGDMIPADIRIIKSDDFNVKANTYNINQHDDQTKHNLPPPVS